jgi:ankyrin repeat protein
LFVAAQNGHVDAVAVLLAAQSTVGVDVNRARADGVTPLIVAAEQNHPTVVAALLELANVKVNAVNRHGSTALAIASRNGHTAVVRLLLLLDNKKLSVNKVRRSTEVHSYLR